MSLIRISPDFHEFYSNDCQLTCYNHNCDIPIRFRTPVCQMNEYRPISAELQHNFHILPHFISKTNEPIFTIFSHYQRVHPQDDRTFRFRIQERKVKMVNFDVVKNRPKLIGYHGNVIGLLRNLCRFYNLHIHIFSAAPQTPI